MPNVRHNGLLLWLWLMTGAAAISAQDRPPGTIEAAAFKGATERYAHGVLGDTSEWQAITITRRLDQGNVETVTHILPSDHVFEDLAPRLVDLDLDGWPDAAMVVETDMAQGAALALYNGDGKIAETPHIGRSFRWLAPLGAADLDGDGHVEIAYIDRPHLARTLRIWRYRGLNLEHIAMAPGLTNHRIGDAFISGGIRHCGTGPEIITADANWHRVMASRLANTQIITRDIGPYDGMASLEKALACQ